MFSGNLSKISLAEVIRLLSMSSQTGALVIEERGFSGMLYLQLGQVVHAACGNLEGLDALNELTVHRTANFAFNEGFAAPARTLADYPTEKLIDKLKKRIDELQALDEAVPGPYDIPSYQAGRKVQGLVARPDELSLLLLADGQRTVMEIAQSIRKDVGEVAAILGKFRYAGVVDIQEGTPPVDAQPSPGSPASEQTRVIRPGNTLLPTQPATDHVEGEKTARYWRGKKIE